MQVLEQPQRRRQAGTAGEVLRVFARLGVSAFGGPVAHIGYFRAAFVARRGWLDEAAFADLVALCQFLPGPASSQVGFAIGLLRAGPLGGLAAWAAFTLPSALLMAACALGAAPLAQTAHGAGVLHGLKLAAVAVVAQAVVAMARSLCPDRPRGAIAGAAAVLVLTVPGMLVPLAAIVVGGLAGWAVVAPAGTVAAGHEVSPVSRRAGAGLLALFAALLALSFVPWGGGVAGLFAAFYRVGALVFGGGHVVLPLLRDAVVTPGFVTGGPFLAGYGAAQAVPGPLFTFAAYLGMAAAGAVGAVAALAAIFLPGMLLVAGTLPFWGALRSVPAARSGLGGVNAAVVGLLGAALYDPVWTSAVAGRTDAAVAVAAFVLLLAVRAPPLLVVALCAAAGFLI
jgi:chromate transporter